MKLKWELVALALVIGSQSLIVWKGDAAPPKVEVNAAQFTAPDIPLSCPPNVGFRPTDLQLTFVAEGRPVLLSFAAFVRFAQDGTSVLKPMMDGQDLERLGSSNFNPSWIGTGVMNEGTLAQFHRLYVIPAGTHTFSVDMACGATVAGANILGPRWLTVVELGSSRP